MGSLRNALLLAGLLLLGVARAAEPFVVGDIRAEGLQRISAGTLFNYLPIKVGDRVDDERSAAALKELYATGFFDDVRFERDGDVLIVLVDERPAIAEISFTGNKAIETEQLEEGLRGIGLQQGQVFNTSLLDRIEQELTQLYFAQGKYGVQIESTVTPLERNRVSIEIGIREGQVAKIRQIRIIGNEDFEEEELVDLFQLTTPGWFTFFTDTDQYSKQKLAADIEQLRSFYLDRGYLRFNINSTQVTISPDRQDVYITVNLTEGEPYTVSAVNLSGELVLADDELTPLVRLRPGNTFSRRLATASSEALSQRLGDEGFAFANVNAVPEIDDENRTVEVTFFVDPGRRVYVRRINMRGNNATRDEVLRREMRQMEGAWFSTSKVNRSRARLQQLGFFEEVTIETPAVPGSPDEVDLEFQVKETPAGSFTVGVGFSQTQGVIFSGSVSQDNFFGTGSRVSLSVNTSQANTVLDYAYQNPYYTIDGISRGFRVFVRKTDADELNITNASIDSYGASTNFGLPLSEQNRLRFEFEYKNTEIELGSNPRSDLVGFVAENGNTYDTLSVAASWSDDTRDKAIFPTRGGRQRLFTEVALPIDLAYYTVGYEHTRYWPLTEDLTFSLDGRVAYGDGYSDTEALPPFEKFFAGGLNCVRGFEENSLGPRDPATGDPLGGNMRVCGIAEVLTPLTIADIRSVRLSGFFDIGNVFDTILDEDFEFDELRYSTGVAINWLSPIGPLTFSYAFPINDESGDETQSLQFRIGGTF
ncbi:MAG: outer membrane protein assembly factor BamA [Gammaproteobacteria bacterium]|nr:outer membrane protein assembly factor BamA [Gammaproteobacteria bacterium]